MSTIGNVNSGTNSLIPQLSLRQKETTGAQGPSEALRAEFEQKFQAAAESAGLDLEALSGLKDEIQTAITKAVENYQDSGESGSLEDAISTVINDTLEQNGFDPEDVQQRLQTAMDSMRESMGPPPANGQGPMGPPPGMKPQGETQSTTEQDSSATSTQTDLVSLLQSLQENNKTENVSDFSQMLTNILFGLDVQA